MAEQEKGAAFWAEPVRIGLTEVEWNALGALGGHYGVMLSDFLLGKPVEIPPRALLYKLICEKEAMLLQAMKSLAEQLHSAGVLSDADFARVATWPVPARKEGELVFVEILKAEGAALFGACCGIALLLTLNFKT